MATATSSQLKQVMSELERAGSESVRNRGVRQNLGQPQFGVLSGKLRALAKSIGQDHELALQLWDTGNYDAQLLAAIVLEPARLTAKEANRLVKSLSNVQLLDELTIRSVAIAPCAPKLLEPWMGSKKELIGRAGWNLAVGGLLARRTDHLDIDALLERIEAEILQAPLPKQDAMNRCIVEIAVKLPEYRKAGIALGKRLGRFDKRPVPRGCVSPYAPEWIAAVLKTLDIHAASRKKAAKKKTAKKKAGKKR